MVPSLEDGGDAPGRQMRNAELRRKPMADNKESSGAEKMFGDFAPALVGFTDDVLFGQVWPRQELSPKDRSLVTVASLVTSGSTEQLVYHLGLARENGASEEELIEAITHLAFYAGWPKAMSAMAVAKRVFRGD
jgi:4-carboxymuconolactone decarboxylase